MRGPKVRRGRQHDGRLVWIDVDHKAETRHGRLLGLYGISLAAAGMVKEFDEMRLMPVLQSITTVTWGTQHLRPCSLYA